VRASRAGWEVARLDFASVPAPDYHDPMRSLASLLSVVSAAAAVSVAAPSRAEAGVGVGLFIGEPLGFTLKADLQRKTSLEFLLGVDDYDEDRGRDAYGHVTFLVAPFAARGESVVIPFRLGIGGAVWGHEHADGEDHVGVGVRAPFQVAFQFRSAPIELYLELSLMLRVIDDHDDLVDLGGGLGFRIYF
jgi:hypothetical protein